MNAGTGIVVAVILIAVGVFPVLCGLNVIPSDDSDFPVGRKWAVLFGSIFPLLGLGFLITSCQSYVEKYQRLRLLLEKIAGCFIGAALVLFVGGGAVFLTMEAIQPTGAESYISIGPVSFRVPPQIARFTDRLLIGLAALIMDTLVVVGIYHALKTYISKFRKTSHTTDQETGDASTGV